MYVSDVAFFNEDEEHAHFNVMKGRLDALNSIQKHLSAALESLLDTQTWIGAEVEGLSGYVLSLAPQSLGVQPESPPSAGARPEQIGTETTNRSAPSKSKLSKLVVKKFRVSTPILASTASLSTCSAPRECFATLKRCCAQIPDGLLVNILSHSPNHTLL